MMLHFSYYCKYEVLVFGDDGQALLMSPKGRNASRDGLVKLWEGGFYYLQYYYYFVKNRVIRVNMHIKRVDCLYNSINRYMIRLW